MIDFTDCKIFNKSYAGANGSKICIEYEGEKYMLKFPSVPTKKTELSYANGCVSEYIGCHIYEMAGIPVQKTLLGTYKKNDKIKIVVACKDFTDIGIILQDFGSLKNQIIDSIHNGYGTELSDIIQTIEEQTAIDPIELKGRFWSMFVMDALLGNFDRHNGNWGFLYDQQTDKLKLAPVYDCGSCLYPQADKNMIIKILSNEGEINTRVYNFPTSAIKQNNKKISYYAYLTGTTNIDCLHAILDIYPKLNITNIIKFIDSVEGVPEIQKSFYKTMLERRYDLILTPAFKRAKELVQISERKLLEDQLEDHDTLEDYEFER